MGGRAMIKKSPIYARWVSPAKQAFFPLEKNKISRFINE
jgi:hypothetical protein